MWGQLSESPGTFWTRIVPLMVVATMGAVAMPPSIRAGVAAPSPGDDVCGASAPDRVQTVHLHFVKEGRTMVPMAKRLAWALAGTLVGFGFLGPIVGPVLGLIGLVLAVVLAEMHGEETHRLMPWLAIGAVVTVAVFVGVDLLAPQRCTPTGCTESVGAPVRLGVALVIEVLLVAVDGTITDWLGSRREA